MILMIDNYDSFTYNLIQYISQLGEEVVVFRNDALTLSEIEQLNPSAIVLSPGPSTPKEAGICLDVVHHFKGKIPILGICLGHQVIAQAFGGNVVKGKEPVHGKIFKINHFDKGSFKGLPTSFSVTRYHSLIVERESLPEKLWITAETDEGVIMGILHRDFPIEGVQFHPEAILTEHGLELMNHFIKRYVKNAN